MKRRGSAPLTWGVGARHLGLIDRRPAPKPGMPRRPNTNSSRELANACSLAELSRNCLHNVPKSTAIGSAGVKMSHQRHASHDAVKEPHYVSVKVLRQRSRLDMARRAGRLTTGTIDSPAHRSSLSIRSNRRSRRPLSRRLSRPPLWPTDPTQAPTRPRSSSARF